MTILMMMIKKCTLVCFCIISNFSFCIINRLTIFFCGTLVYYNLNQCLFIFKYLHPQQHATGTPISSSPSKRGIYLTLFCHTTFQTPLSSVCQLPYCPGFAFNMLLQTHNYRNVYLIAKVNSLIITNFSSARNERVMHCWRFCVNEKMFF